MAPDPSFGSTGIQLVDMNADGKLDVLYTNGDIFDPAPLAKPYHGIRWLENQGAYPYQEHFVTQLSAAHAAVAADLTGAGDRGSRLPLRSELHRRA